MNPTSEAIMNQNNVSLHELSEKENKNQGLMFTLLSYNAEVSTTDDQDYFSTLPKETILHIFKFLSTLDLKMCAMVSKLWHVMSFSSELWSNATLSSICIEVSFLERILNCNVKNIYLEYLKINIQKPLVLPLFKTPRFDSLQKINIYYSTVEIELVEELLRLSPNLKTIELFSICEFIGINFFRQIVNLQFLEKIDLHSFKIENILEIVKILKNAEKFEKLQTLSFSSFYPDMYGEFSEQSKLFLESLLALCPNLEVLKLPDNNINNTTFNYILNMHNLKDLNISSATTNSNIILPHKENCEMWANLQNLNVSDIRMPENIRTFLLHLSPNLESLHIGGIIKDSTFEQIMNMKNLKNLYFSESSLKIQTDLKKDKTLINLRRLGINRAHMSENIQLLLIDHSPNLEYFSVGGVITYSVFEQIINMKNLKELQLFDIDLTILNDFHSDDKFDKLRALHVSTTKRFKKNFLSKLLSYCENLQNLNLSGFGIDPDFLREIPKMENLEELDFYSIKTSSALDLRQNFRNCKKLKRLKSVRMIFDEPKTNPTCAENILLLCKDLTCLDLRISSVTERMWKCILSMSEIENLSLCDLDTRNDDNIPNVNSLPKLLKVKKLAWTYMKRQFRPRRLEDFLSLCPNVDNLYLKFTFLTDSICKSIASMKELKALHLTFVSGISKNKISDILKECPKLTRKKIIVFDLSK